MANTYTQLGIHIVSAVKHRKMLIHPKWQHRVEAFLKTVVEERDHTMLQVRMRPDHLHAFIGLHPKDSISNLVGSFKAQCSGFITRTFDIEFDWQRGYGAFSVSKSLWPTVRQYIANQDEHHAHQDFSDEYIALLEEHEVKYDPRYLFDDVYLG